MEEAVKIDRGLAKTDLYDLNSMAATLNNLGNCYKAMGRRQNALATSEEAVKIRRELAETNPLLQDELAASVGNLGNRYSELGRLQEALAPTEKAVKIYRGLAKFHLAYQESLTINSTNLALLQLRLANPSAALPLLRESVSTEVTYLQGQLPLVPEGRRLALMEV
ncbi:MAG: tetratricopeptide repeat protein, partial [Cyanobacteriota bacterium]